MPQPTDDHWYTPQLVPLPGPVRNFDISGTRVTDGGGGCAVLEDFTTAISLSPNAAEPYNARGVSYLASGDQENALSDINRALRLDDKNAEAWTNLALIQEKRGERRKAFKSYARAVALNKNYGPAREGMSRTRNG